MFVHYNNKIVNTHDITQISLDDLAISGNILVKRIGFIDEIVKGAEAINVIMAICPGALEGVRMKWLRNSWAIHNIIAHPLMQILSWIGLSKLGIKIHDYTVPKPSTNEIE